MTASSDLKRLVVIDGANAIYRAFFAIPNLRAPDGTPTNAAYGFVTMLTKVLREERPTHVAVANEQAAHVRFVVRAEVVRFDHAAAMLEHLPVHAYFAIGGRRAIKPVDSPAVNTPGNNWCGMLFACLRTGGCVVGLAFPVKCTSVIF